MPKKPKLPRGITMRNGGYRVRVSYELTQFDIGQFESLTVAKAALEQSRIDIARREFIPPAERRRQLRARLDAEAKRQTTVREWSDEWLDALEHHRKRPRSPATLTSYRSTLNAHILPAIGGVRLVALTEADIDGVLDAAHKRGPGAGRNTAAVLRSMLRAAVTARAGGLETMPATIDVGDGGRRDADTIPSEAEVRKLAAAMEPSLRLSVELGAWTGLRLGEILGLQVRDLDLDGENGPELHVRRQWLSKGRPPRYGPPKAGSARVVAIPRALVPRVREHLEAYASGEPDAPLFPSSIDGTRPISHTAYSSRWDAARKAIDRPAMNAHALRHFHLSEYSRRGATAAETQARGGHRDPSTAQLYQHAERRRDHEIADSMLREG